jgi:hypothetical protein
MSQTILGNVRKGEAILEVTPKFYTTWDHGKVKCIDIKKKWSYLSGIFGDP